MPPESERRPGQGTSLRVSVDSQFADALILAPRQARRNGRWPGQGKRQ